MNVPVIDLAGFVGGSTQDRADIGALIDRACREVGFFSVTGHGVADEIIERAHDAALDFFHLLIEDRMAVAVPSPGYPYGYLAFHAESLSRSLGGDALPDMKETFNVGPIDPPPRPLDEMVDADERAIHSPNLWPAEPARLRPALEAYYRAMSHLARTLMDTFSVALGLGDGWFDPFIDRHPSALRLAYYPALAAAPPAGALRAGAHTDYGTLTILRMDDQPGLQIRAGDGTWIDVDAPPGALVVNLGDLMERWTNDRWRSTMHRVVAPEESRGHERLTIPFFHNANWDARIEAIGDGPAAHPPLSAGAHLMSKFRSTTVT